VVLELPEGFDEKADRWEVEKSSALIRAYAKPLTARYLDSREAQFTFIGLFGSTINLEIQQPDSNNPIEGDGWTYGDDWGWWLDIHDGANVLIEGESAAAHVRIDENAHARVALKNVTLDPSARLPFELRSGAQVTLHLLGVNTITAHDESAGISVPEGTTLTIKDGDGSLTVKGDGNGAGIGADRWAGGAGTIVIAGGIIDAKGADGAAGIGGSFLGSGGSITISGGRGTAAPGGGAPSGTEAYLAGGGFVYAVGPGLCGSGGSFNGVEQTDTLNPWPAKDIVNGSFPATVTTYTWGN